MTPESIASEVFSFCLHASGHSSSSLELKIRENVFTKHYKPLLVSFIASYLSNLGPDSITYKVHESLIVACIRKLGF